MMKILALGHHHVYNSCSVPQHQVPVIVIFNFPSGLSNKPMLETGFAYSLKRSVKCMLSLTAVLS